MASITQTAPNRRPRFAEGQVLDASDLTAEQTYLIAARRRHLFSGHTPGIVNGLEPSLQGGVVTVSPGLAIDGAGRELVLSKAAVARAQPGTSGPAGDVGIYIQYSLVAAGADPSHPRWSEQADVVTGPPSTQAAPVFDLTAPPDDADALVWPVLLGVVRAGNAGLDLTGRKYAGAIGSAVSTPAGTSRITFGQTGSVSFTVAGGTAPAVGVDARGTTVTGDAVLDGALTLGAVDSAAPAGPRRLVLRSKPFSPGPSPWSLYRTSVPATKPTATTPGTPAFEDLRIELPAPPAGPDPTQRAVSVGVGGTGNSFARTLSVLTDGTVLINGDLHVRGRLATAPAQLDPSDPRVRQALLANFIGGVQAGTGALEEQYTGRLGLSKLQLDLADGEIACTVSLDNIGAVVVENITVTGAVWLDGTRMPAPDQTLATVVQLQAQASLTVQGSLKPPGSGAMNVLVRAIGTGLAGITIQAIDLSGSVNAGTGGAA
jgi:hypothetical protein